MGPSSAPSVARRSLLPGCGVVAIGAEAIAIAGGCVDHADSARPDRASVTAAPGGVARVADERPVRDDAAPVVLERTDPIAVAGGGGYAAWVVRGRVVVRAPGQVPRVLPQPLPPGVDQLAIGTGAGGRLTVVVASSGRRAPLSSMPADGSVPPKRLPFSGPSATDSAPGIDRGVVSFSRTERTGGRARHVLRVARISARTSTRLWDGARHTSVTGTLPTRGGAAFVTSDDAYDTGSSHTLRLIRRGGRSRTLENATSGESAPAGFGALQAATRRNRFVAVRWTDDQRSHPSDQATYRAPSGRLVSRHRTRSDEGDWGIDVPDGRVYTDMDLAMVGRYSGQGALVLVPTNAAP